MCLEQHPPLPGPETQMHCCPTFRKVPPEAVSVGPSERCGEPTTEKQAVFDNSWTLMLSVYTNMENTVFPMGQAKSVNTPLRHGDKSLNLGDIWKH